MTRAVRFFVILGIGLLILDGAVFALVANRPARPELPASRVVSSGTALVGGPFTLITTGGRAVTDQTYRGKWILIYFGYTSCPDACPTTLTNMGAALNKLGEEANPVQPLFI